MKILLLLAVSMLSGCVTVVPNEEKTRWYDDEFSTEAWIQFMEFEITHRSKRIENL